MSKKADRERAESGWIWRDGQLVSKEDWYAAHPTREMLAERQAQVDRAIAEEMAKPTIKSYFCTKCNRKHNAGSKVFKEHWDFMLVNGIPEDGSDPTH